MPTLGIGIGWLAAATAATVGSQVYSASKESSAAKKAAEAQKQVGLAQIEASSKAEETALSKASAKLKARQASRTDTILTSPGGLEPVAQAGQKTLLGV